MKQAFTALMLIVGAAASLPAQNAVPPAGWSLTALGGGAAFTAFQHGTFQAVATGPDETLVQREFPRRVSAKTAGSFAAALAYWPSENWGARLYASYSPSRFQTMVPQGDAERFADTREAAEGESPAALAITAIEAQGLIRLPTIRRKLVPYGVLGVGAVRYASAAGAVPEEARQDFASGSRVKPAVRVGVGGRLQMRPAGLGLNFELTDQIAATPVRGDGGEDVSLTNAISFMVGLSWVISRR